MPNFTLEKPRVVESEVGDITFNICDDTHVYLKKEEKKRIERAYQRAMNIRDSSPCKTLRADSLFSILREVCSDRR